MEMLFDHYREMLVEAATEVIENTEIHLVFTIANTIFFLECCTCDSVTAYIPLYTTYDCHGSNWDEQLETILRLANDWNKREPQCRYFEDNGVLIERFDFICHEVWNYKFYAETTILVMVSSVADEMYYIKNDEVLGAWLGKEGFLGWKTPQERLAESQQWTDVRQYTEGLVAVANHEGFYGFLDADIREAIPCRWTDAQPFSEGLAAVADDRGRYGFIDHKGLIMIPCEWHRADWFSEGLAAVMDANGEWGFIDKDAHLVVPCEWDEVEWFEHGRARVYDAEHHQHIIDREGRIISVGE